jgi:hypothetical protein
LIRYGLAGKGNLNMSRVISVRGRGWRAAPGHAWANVAAGQFGAGPVPQFSSDGAGGLWLPMDGPAGGAKAGDRGTGVVAVLPQYG